VPHPVIDNPEGHKIERRHFGAIPLSPTHEWRSTLKQVEPIDHTADPDIGLTKVIRLFTLVKPKIDRVPKIHPRLGSTQEKTLADMLPGKMFLQKYHGVRSRILQNNAMEKHSLERVKRTDYPPIDPYVSGTEHLQYTFNETAKYYGKSIMFK
jgi:hypothetical protein